MKYLLCPALLSNSSPVKNTMKAADLLKTPSFFNPIFNASHTEGNPWANNRLKYAKKIIKTV